MLHFPFLMLVYRKWFHHLGFTTCHVFHHFRSTFPCNLPGHLGLQGLPNLVIGRFWEMLSCPHHRWSMVCIYMNIHGILTHLCQLAKTTYHKKQRFSLIICQIENTTLSSLPDQGKTTKKQQKPGRPSSSRGTHPIQDNICGDHSVWNSFNTEQNVRPKEGVPILLFQMSWMLSAWEVLKVPTEKSCALGVFTFQTSNFNGYFFGNTYRDNIILLMPSTYQIHKENSEYHHIRHVWISNSYCWWNKSASLPGKKKHKCGSFPVATGAIYLCLVNN